MQIFFYFPIIFINSIRYIQCQININFIQTHYFNQNPMAEPQSTDFKKIITQKQMKFQWGIAEPVVRNQINTKTQVTDINKQGSNPQPQQPTPKGKLAPNMINFQDLPVKQSQIITTQKQKEYTYSKRIASHSPNSSGVFNETKQHLQRLSNLKNQFQILKGIMIDSKIFEGHRKSSQLANNTSKSNLGSLSNTRQVKIGEAVRGKDKISRKDKLSSSSMSEKEIPTKYAHLKQRDNIVNKESYNYTENAERDISNSKISNKRSQHHSQNRKVSGSKNGSRVNENRHGSPRVGSGLMSSNLLQKHSLQLQLRNCLQKIQLLLQNQIILKTKNNELQQKLRDIASNSTQQKQDSGLLLKNQELSQKLIEYEQRIQGYRQQNRQLVQRVAKLQAEAISNEAIMQMLKREKNKEINSTMQMKLAYANLQIQNKRLQMQKQIDKRDLEYEIDRLKKEKQRFKELEQQKQIYVTAIQHEVGSANIQKDLLKSQYHMERQTDRQKIRRLQAELQERQRKYKQFLEDLEKKKQLREEAELLQLVEVLHKKKVEGQGQNQLGRELNRLKDQIIKVKKQVDLTQSQFGFQSKVISLEQALVRDNEQKQKHLLEIERFQKQFEDLKDKYRQCQQELDQQTQRYTKTINQLKSSLQEAEGFKSKYEHAEKQVQHLTKKNDEMERMIRKYQDMQSEIMHLREILSKKQTNHNLQIRDARRRVDQAQFQSFKSQEQNKLSLDLNTRKLSSQIQVLNGKIEAIQNDRNYYRDNYNMLRQQNEFLALKLKDIEFQRENLVKVESQMDLQEKQRARRQHESQISALNTRFIEEQKKLIDQISVLTNINQQLTDKLKRLAFLEIQNDQLRALCKSKVTSDTSVLHLWDIKEVEYSNINEILKFIKDSQKDIKYLETSNAQVNTIQPPIILGQQRIYYGGPPVLPNQTTRIYSQQPQTIQYIPHKQTPQTPQIFPLTIQPQVYGIPPSHQQQPRPILIQQAPQSQATIQQREFSNKGQKLATIDKIIQTKEMSKGQIL